MLIIEGQYSHLSLVELNSLHIDFFFIKTCYLLHLLQVLFVKFVSIGLSVKGTSSLVHQLLRRYFGLGLRIELGIELDLGLELESVKLLRRLESELEFELELKIELELGLKLELELEHFEAVAPILEEISSTQLPLIV